MINMILDYILSILSILFQAGCANIAFKMYIDFYSNGSTKFWWWVWTGFMVMTLRRVTALLINLGVDVPDLGVLDTVLLPLFISICLFVGMFYAYNYNKERSSKMNTQLDLLRIATKKLRHKKDEQDIK